MCAFTALCCTLTVITPPPGIQQYFNSFNIGMPTSVEDWRARLGAFLADNGDAGFVQTCQSVHSLTSQ